jgi:hypothetical protein
VEDDERDSEADDRVGDRHTKCHDDGARDHAEADEAVSASVVPVGDQSRAVEPPSGSRPDLSRNLVADEADYACRGEPP